MKRQRNGRLKSTSSAARLPAVGIWVLPLFMTLCKFVFLGICFLILNMAIIYLGRL